MVKPVQRFPVQVRATQKNPGEESKGLKKGGVLKESKTRVIIRKEGRKDALEEGDLGDEVPILRIAEPAIQKKRVGRKKIIRFLRIHPGMEEMVEVVNRIKEKKERNLKIKTVEKARDKSVLRVNEGGMQKKRMIPREAGSRDLKTHQGKKVHAGDAVKEALTQARR